MKAANDNGDESDVLLEKAYKIVSRYRSGDQCSLLDGGGCPLVNRAVESMKIRDEQYETYKKEKGLG